MILFENYANRTEIATQVAHNKMTLFAAFPTVCYTRKLCIRPGMCARGGGGGGYSAARWTMGGSGSSSSVNMLGSGASSWSSSVNMRALERARGAREWKCWSPERTVGRVRWAFWQAAIPGAPRQDEKCEAPERLEWHGRGFGASSRSSAE